MTAARQNWLDSIRWQSDFYLRGLKRQRTDLEFEWDWFSESQLGGGGGVKMLAKRALSRLPMRSRWNKASQYSMAWIEQNAGVLWQARSHLDDDLSKLLFDQQLVLRATSYEQYYYPRIDFEDFVSVVSKSPFESSDLPTTYLGLPLFRFTLRVPSRSSTPELTIISTRSQVQLLNSYRQYFVRRSEFDSTPRPGDVVIDCGACIGEISLLFAGLVGESGEVHMFDPVPLHARFCELQGELNPKVRGALRINALAVGDATKEQSGGTRTDSSSIAPGGLAIDSFSVTTLDDYVTKHKVRRVDVIKMDIEGAEVPALAGASQLIRDFRPTLTISAYHRQDDLWVIPERIKSLNPRYRLYFGHHSPVLYESVYYAADPQR
ncbi:MAG TPA: FkbM family methyltransferase [Polyangiaceae bacterium]|nr:FkbM family methyltransferase [Polyangiaceae bacterium]